MATDGPDPLPCDPKIFKNGKTVFVTHTIPSNAMEGWVKKVAAMSGQPVDWHFAGGRAVILALGDLPKVMTAIHSLMPEHDALYRAAYSKILPGLEVGDDEIPRPRPCKTITMVDADGKPMASWIE